MILCVGLNFRFMNCNITSIRIPPFSIIHSLHSVTSGTTLVTNCDNLMTYGVYKEFRKVDDHAPFVKVRVRQESLVVHGLQRSPGD